jgi:ABC-type phosphate transport system substrate-binding protein
MQFPWALRLLVAVTATATLAFTAGDSRAATREPTRPDPARADAFMIVVNDQNATSAMSRALVSRYFLKKVSRWDSGAVALPVDLPADSPVRDAFSRRVLSKSVSSIRAYWQQQIFSGRDVPPPEKPDDASVLEFVRANPAAIAYVSSVATLPSGVRVLTITD